MLESYITISTILFIAMGASLAILIPLLFIQHFIYKKIFDPTFFNNKHYSAYELQIFTSFPLLLIKTLGYIKAIVFPDTMRRKFEKNIIKPKERPVIYLLAWLTMLIIIYYGLVLINTLIMAIFYYSNY